MVWDYWWIILWPFMVFYLWHRVAASCHDGWSIVFVMAEIMVIMVGAVNTCFLVMGEMRRRDRPERVRGTPSPGIMIFVPTYREGPVILRRTLDAVRRIRYPRHIMVVVGDDGNDPDIRRLVVDEYGMRYHTRRTIHGHAKAGNINDMLASYDEEFLLVLDCDMAPRPDILENMMPLFYDEEGGLIEDMAFVQSRQSFCNIGPYDALGQHYYFFYGVVMKAWSGYGGGVPCCGTNVIYNVRHLRSIGGLQFGSITEDFNTSLVFHARGLRSDYYHDEMTAVGFAPTTLYDFYKQRERWTIGGYEIVFSSRFWSLFPKLSWHHRWIYAFPIITPVVNICLIVLMIGPVMDLLRTRNVSCGVNDLQYVRVFWPYAFTYLSLILFLHRSMPLATLMNSIQETLFMAPLFLLHFMTFVSKRVFRVAFTFRTTPKMRSQGKTMSMITSFILFSTLSYIGVALFAMIDNIRTLRHRFIDAFWIVFIIFQLFPPVMYVIMTSDLGTIIGCRSE